MDYQTYDNVLSDVFDIVQQEKGQSNYIKDLNKILELQIQLGDATSIDDVKNILSKANSIKQKILQRRLENDQKIVAQYIPDLVEEYKSLRQVFPKDSSKIQFQTLAKQFLGNQYPEEGKLPYDPTKRTLEEYRALKRKYDEQKLQLRSGKKKSKKRSRRMKRSKTPGSRRSSLQNLTLPSSSRSP